MRMLMQSTGGLIEIAVRECGFPRKESVVIFGVDG